MTRLQRIENQIAELSPDELRDFRAWFAAFDADMWDRKLEQDIQLGALDGLAEDALVAHRSGRTKEL